ncbi:MAG: hypothetical protein ABH883_06905 [Candidatus Omnitrophota bacterium]
MKIAFLKSFDKAYIKLPEEKQCLADKAIEKLIPCLEDIVTPAPKGLGLEKRRGGFGYCRIDIHLRILFKQEKDLLIFYLLGTHKQIDNYLKNI